ncbi:MAG: glycoside hydrolase family 20 zincin-like fold domain-containing protein [Myxococcota bacterium]
MKGQLQLLPRPRELAFAPGVCALSSAPRVSVSGPRDAVADRVRERLSALRTRVTLRVDPAALLPREGFELAISPRGIELVGRDSRGLNWGASALVQIAAQRAQLPCLRMRDWPDLVERGYMLDVSRDRVPTMATLAELVDLLELLRVNQLQLYMEHTFAYRDHAQVWRDASPFSAEEIRTVDAWCAARGIELVPNQNGFGHMERWLAHPRYAPLAELGEGGAGPGTTVAPTPESVALVRSLYAELLPNFSSRQVNIGCDEPFELGRGRSRARCAAEGRGRVYLDHLLQLVRPLQAEGRTVQFWGDIIGQHPELIPELPREKLVALAWGYEAPLDPAELPAQLQANLANVGFDLESLRGFETQARRYREVGVPFTVCPGTSAWLSLVGRVPNALGNVADAARTAVTHGARGLLVTDWGDQGHLQPPVVSLPGLCCAAALAWSADSQAELDLFRAIDVLILRDATGTVGAALARLGGLYARTGIRALNSSPLATALLRPFKRYEPTWGSTDAARLNAIVAEIDATRAELARATPIGFGGRIAARELSQAAGLARHGAFRLMHACLGRGPKPELLRRELGELIAEQRACWLARSREGGLSDSLGRLERARAEYAA